MEGTPILYPGLSEPPVTPNPDPMGLGRQPITYMQAHIISELDILWKLYEQMVAAEYEELGKHKNTKPAFTEFAERGGLKKYKELRPVYFRYKIREPHRFLIDFLQDGGVTLAGRPVKQGVHTAFASMLAKADTLLKSTPLPRFGVEQIKYIGCFRPSDLDPSGSNPLRRISNHMIGAAIDIDSGDNPNLKKEMVGAIDAILAFREQTGHAPLSIKVSEVLAGKLPSEWHARGQSIAS